MQKTRIATYDRRIVEAPVNFNAPQWRVLLRALISLDPYMLADDLAAELTEDDENDQRSTEQVLTDTIAALSDDKLTGFAVRVALSGHTGIPHEGETNLLAEAETAFSAAPAKKTVGNTPKKRARPEKTAVKAANRRKTAA